MDEAAVYFEDARTESVDIRGRKHVVIKSTGLASMRITALVSVWANGAKAPPLIIHKGKDGQVIERASGPLLFKRQEKAWVNERLIIKWIDSMFPVVEIVEGKAIVWDSCRAHISKKVKEHCQTRNIELIVIPGGLNPFLRAGDIGIFKELKDKISVSIDSWKNSENVEYTARGNPKPPRENIVHSWVIDAWRSVSVDNISRSIQSAGFLRNFEDWHISKHDVYGNMFKDAWTNNRGTIEVNTADLEQIPQDDDIEEIIDITRYAISLIGSRKGSPASIALHLSFTSLTFRSATGTCASGPQMLTRIPRFVIGPWTWSASNSPSQLIAATVSPALSTALSCSSRPARMLGWFLEPLRFVTEVRSIGVKTLRRKGIPDRYIISVCISRMGFSTTSVGSHVLLSCPARLVVRPFTDGSAGP